MIQFSLSLQGKNLKQPAFWKKKKKSKKRSKTHKRLNRMLLKAFCFTFHVFLIPFPLMDCHCHIKMRPYLCEFLRQRVMVLALGLLEICWACLVHWVTGQMLNYTPAPFSEICWRRLVTADIFVKAVCFTFHVFLTPFPLMDYHCHIKMHPYVNF